MKTVRTALILLLVSLVTPLTGQDAAAYVSRLTAQAGTQSVLLTWKDAAGYAGAKYEVWRAAKEIVKETFAQAKLLATVDSGTEAFEDKTVTGPSFYLVLLKDRSGNRKTFYIPYRNKTTVAVQPGSPPQATAQIKLGAVTYANPQLVVAFEATPPERKLVVFRRTSPIRTVADLKDSTLLGNTSGAAAPYRDTPPPGLEFYYAIVDAQAFSDNRADAFQADNATDAAFGFPLVALPKDVQDSRLDPSLRPKVDTASRALPLPILRFDSEPDSGAPLVSSAYQPVPAQPLPEGAQTALKKVAKAAAAGTSLPSPVVLPEERSVPQEGAAKYLVEIQKSYLQPKDWKGAAEALRTVLKLTLEERLEARARFYLGESLAYMKNYRQAFVELLSARDDYPDETKPFLDALLSLLASETD